MTTPDDIEVLAGEYVLGTLDAAERTAVAARRLREPALDKAIRGWEQRLAPLDDETASRLPPPDLLSRIEQRLDASRSSLSASNLLELETIKRRMARWRTAALAASALAASLLTVVVWRESAVQRGPQTFVGVFAQDDVLPRFYLTIDLASRELTIRPIGAERQPDRTYQLWIASDRIGPAPQSLGLLDDQLGTTRKSLSTFDPGLLRVATFGVSVEPLGGSTTGRPSAGALHAKLLPVVADP